MIVILISMARNSFKTLLRFLDNGTYIPISRDFGIRRYVFPKDADLQKKLCESLKAVSLKVYQNDLPAFPFLHGNHTSLSNRIICLAYERNDKKQQPIGFNVPYVTRGLCEDIIHSGLTLIDEAHQGGGVMQITPINIMLFVLLHGSNYVITSLGATTVNFRLMEKYCRDTYPNWRDPDLQPSKWHMDIAKLVLANHDFVCDLEESTLVVRGFNKGDGPKQLHNTSSSRNPALRKFMEDRLDISNGDAQFIVGRAIPATEMFWRIVF